MTSQLPQLAGKRHLKGAGQAASRWKRGMVHPCDFVTDGGVSQTRPTAASPSAQWRQVAKGRCAKKP